jgi:hypothetical protein
MFCLISPPLKIQDGRAMAVLSLSSLDQNHGFAFFSPKGSGSELMFGLFSSFLKRVCLKTMSALPSLFSQNQISTIVVQN